jgi:DNA-directed RNA polymerase subunit M/transcription elongation factor TFIIS
MLHIDCIRHSAFGREAAVRHFRPPRAGGHLFCFLDTVPNAAPTVSSAGDITFACAHCSSALVVDAAAAGLTLECQRCGKPTPVPAVSPRQTQSAQAQAQLADLERQLKENESQRTEITGYINQLSIQLHRWQLRLQTLNERRQQLEKEVRAAK